jgi:transposase
VHRVDAIFAIEREISGATAEQRLVMCEERVKPFVGELEGWMLTGRTHMVVATP